MHPRFSAGIPFVALGALLLGASPPAPSRATSGLSKRQSLGKELFFDTSLSEPPGQSCASCHDPANHFGNPKHTMIAEGATPGRFGNRKPPSIAYASFSPDFHYDAAKKDYYGGYFWDGRAKSLQDQAKGPLLNPAEMNNVSQEQVVAKVAGGPSSEAFRQVYGETIFVDRERAYNAIANAIAEYERSSDFHPFTSKYDAYLRGEATLTKQEQHGLKVFESEKLGNCAACHPSKPGPNGEPPLFTDFSYDNIGLPRNSKSPYFHQTADINPAGDRFVDVGLSKTTKRPQDVGRFKVPSLRNVAANAPYFHHSGIASLKDAILFYSVRDSGRFGNAEIAKTMNRKELGRLNLTQTQVQDLEAFLQTLTDGYSPSPRVAKR